MLTMTTMSMNKNKTQAMEATSTIQLPISLLTNCKLTICDKIPSDDGKLYHFITDTLEFKIIKTVPLIIEKDDPSPDDINKLLDFLKDLLPSHNRKDDKLVERHRDSFALKQKEGKVTCESLAQISSSQEANENRQSAKYTTENQYDDNSTYEVSSQAHGTNDDVLDLINNFQRIRMNDVSDDNGYIQGHNQFENNLSVNAIFRELTNAQLELENENITLPENVTDAEKQENNSQDRGKDKKPVETTQPEYFRKHDNVAEHGSADVQIMQNTAAAKKNEMKQKQHSHYLEHRQDNVAKHGSADVQIMQNTAAAKENEMKQKQHSHYLEHRQDNVAKHGSADVQIMQNTAAAKENEMKQKQHSHYLEHRQDNVAERGSADVQIMQNTAAAKENEMKQKQHSHYLEHRQDNVAERGSADVQIMQNTAAAKKNEMKQKQHSHYLEHRQDNVAKHGSADVQIMQNTAAAKENEMKQKQHSHYLEHRQDNVAERGSADVQIMQNTAAAKENEMKQKQHSHYLEHRQDNVAERGSADVQIMQNTAAAKENEMKQKQHSHYLEHRQDNVAKHGSADVQIMQNTAAAKENEMKQKQHSHYLEHRQDNVAERGSADVQIMQNTAAAKENEMKQKQHSHYLEHRQDNVAKHGSADVQIMQNTAAAKENEMKQKQHSHYLEHRQDNVAERGSADVQIMQNTASAKENEMKQKQHSHYLEHRQDNVAKHGSADVQIMQNTAAAKENEMKQKQHSHYLEHRSTYEEKSSIDIEEVDVTNTQLIAGQKNNSNQAGEKISRENNKQLKEMNEDCANISVKKSDRKTTDHVQCGEHAKSTYEKITESVIAPSQEGLSKQNNVTQYSSLECRRQDKVDIQVHSQDMKTEKKNYEILETNTRTDMSHAKNNNEMQSVVVSEDADINKAMKMPMHVDDKNKNHNMTSIDFAYRVETREDHVHHPSSVQNVLLTSEISSRSHEIKDNVDAESENVTIFSTKASYIDGIKMYFKDPHYGKYFSEAKIEGKSVIFTLNTCNDKDVSFMNKLKQLKVEECEFDHKDIRLNSAVEDMQVQTRELIIQIKDNKVYIVGSKDSVISAKKRLQLLLQHHDPKNSQHLDMVEVNKSTATRKESLEKKNPDTQKNQETSRTTILHDEKTHDPRSSQKSEFTERHHRVSESPSGPHYAGSGTYSGASGCSLFINDQNIFYVGNEKNKLRVQVSNTDITQLKVDCIVNAANKRLQHAGGVAKAISSAAGPALKKECGDFIQSGKQVAVTDIFVSTGGNMPAKCVMHAVGPKWEFYDENSKSQCLQDLRHTVIRCLVEADRRGFTSIALPSISAAIFKVPKESCAKCYMEAVKHFGKFDREKTSLRDIRFVDVDETMVKIIQEHFQRNWANPCDSHTVQKDCEFAKAHVFSAARNAARNTEKLPDTNKFTSSSSISTKTPGAGKSSSVVGDRSLLGNTVASSSDLRTERSSVYQIGKFTLHTDPRPAFNYPADITITVGKPFDKLSGLRDFSVLSNKKKKENLKNKYKLFSVSKPKGQQEKFVYALLPEPDNADTIKEAIGNLTTIMESTNYKMFKQTIKKVVLTSSILYNEPNNTQKKGGKHINDRKKVGDFARCLFDYLDHPPGNTASGISITVVGDEDALQSIHKVLESRDVKKIAPEVHQGASSMAREPSSYGSQVYSGQHSGYAVQGASYTKQQIGEDVGSSVDSGKACEICACTKPLQPVRCCGKSMCQTCEQRMSSCPFCRTFWRVPVGDQPPGTMTVCTRNDHANGYENTRAWEIQYFFLSGVQQEHHPNPGKMYTGMSRKAFLPMNDEGFYVLKLLRLAFLRKLTFTIGHSLTMDRENSIVWNDIHHKTNLHGGPHGYPDSNYLFNVTQELARKGVTFDTLSEDERYAIDLFERHVKFGYFTDIHPR